MREVWKDKALVKMECSLEGKLDSIGKSPFVYCSSRLWGIIHKYVKKYTAATNIKFNDERVKDWLKFLKDPEQGNITVMY